MSERYKAPPRSPSVGAEIGVTVCFRDGAVEHRDVRVVGGVKHHLVGARMIRRGTSGSAPTYLSVPSDIKIAEGKLPEDLPVCLESYVLVRGCVMRGLLAEA